MGLDHDEVHRWTGRDRHLTLTMGALARLAALRAGAIAVETRQKSLPPPQTLSVPALRRLLWRVVLAVQQTARHILARSQGRRWHQTVATYDHYKRREAVAEALAA